MIQYEHHEHVVFVNYRLRSRVASPGVWSLVYLQPHRSGDPKVKFKIKTMEKCVTGTIYIQLWHPEKERNFQMLWDDKSWNHGGGGSVLVENVHGLTLAVCWWFERERGKISHWMSQSICWMVVLTTLYPSAVFIFVFFLGGGWWHTCQKNFTEAELIITCNLFLTGRTMETFDIEKHEFMIPVKEVTGPDDIAKWEKSGVRCLCFTW